MPQTGVRNSVRRDELVADRGHVVLPAAAAEEAQRLLAVDVAAAACARRWRRSSTSDDSAGGRSRPPLQPVRRPGSARTAPRRRSRADRLEHLLLERRRRVRHVRDARRVASWSPDQLETFRTRAPRCDADADVAARAARRAPASPVSTRRTGRIERQQLVERRPTIDDRVAARRARITAALSCWLPRPNSEPWPPTTPTTSSRRARRSSAREQLGLARGRRRRSAPSRTASTPSSVPLEPERREIAPRSSCRARAGRGRRGAISSASSRHSGRERRGAASRATLLFGPSSRRRLVGHARAAVEPRRDAILAQRVLVDVGDVDLAERRAGRSR